LRKNMKRILIVDDIPEYVNSLKNALQNDYEVVIASSLTEAKKKSAADIDAYLVDIRLDENDPDNCDGIIFLEWLKKEYPAQPTILMSAYSDSKMENEVMRKGASDFMKKPIFLADLRKKLECLIRD